MKKKSKPKSKSKSKSVHFRANAQDQKRLTRLRKKYETDNAGAIREALRLATAS